MPQLTWNDTGKRFYEVGVDHGVLYIGNNPGVAWNGLVSISESSSGGEAQPYYLDGIKYLNRVSSEEFEATIEAYTYPEEFAQCDGTSVVQNGLFATQQSRKPFGLVYRTIIGNDIDGLDHGYKLHLVYNALAAPSARPNSTINESIDPFNFSWKVTAKPPIFSGRKPTPHFVIDSREAPEGLMGYVEDILYGGVYGNPRLPDVGELVYIFESYNTLIFDAGLPSEPSYYTYDGGPPAPLQNSTIDGGTP